MSVMDDLYAANPWLRTLNISATWLQDAVASSASAQELVSQIRNTPQYKQRFPGLYRPDGSMRMSEAQYVQQEASYRSLLRQFGYDVDSQFATPASLVGWFQNDVSPDELQDRLQVYRWIESPEAQRIKDVFYVYTGLNLGDDDLYEAVVDPAAAQNLAFEFNEAQATQPFDYAMFIERATNLALTKVADALTDLQQRGALTAEAVNRVTQIDPQFAQQLVDQIYTAGGDVNASGYLSLQELMDAVEYTMVGAAAQNAGLSLPTRERLAEIRAAGVERAKMISAYTEFGRDKNALQAAIRRARGETFGVEQFEAAHFLGDAAAGRSLQAGLAGRQAAGVAGGNFRFDERGGRVVQRGLRAGV